MHRSVAAKRNMFNKEYVLDADQITAFRGQMVRGDRLGAELAPGDPGSRPQPRA